jgi:hypothetical protein
MWDPTIHAQPILPSDATQRAPQTGRAIIDDDDAPSHPIPPVHTGSPAIIDNNEDAPPMVRRPQTCAQLCAQAESHLIKMVIQDDHTPNFSLVIKPHKLHHGCLQAAQALAVQTYVLGTDSSCFISAIIDKDTGNTLKYCQLIKIPKYRDIWTHSFANEIGRLFQGIHEHKGTDTCFFMKKLDVPKGRTYTYGRIVCNYCPQKDKPHRTRLTVGGDCIEYPWNKSTPTANLTTAKLLFNSTISTPSASFYGINLANFYLNTPMERYEYMRLQLDILSQEIIDKYNLTKNVDAYGWVHVKICKGMYRLPQAGTLANKRLKKRLAIRGYYQCQHTPGLWHHMWRDITFCLVVNNFGIKTTSMADMKHLVSLLQEHYSVAVVWTGSLFCGVKLKWDNANRMVDLHMPDYVSKASNTNTKLH